MNDEELRQLLPLAALDALDGDVRRRVEAALESRPDLRAELDDLRQAAAQLAPDDVDVPPGLRGTVLAEIAVTEQQPAVAEPPPADVPREATVVTLRSRWWSGLAVAAASVAVVVGAVVWFGLDSSPSTESQARDVIERGDARSLPLSGELEGVEIVYSPSADDAALRADALPELEADRAYQLWYIRDGTPEPANVFRPDDEGDVLELVEDFRPGAVMAITEEPAGGSEQPTSPPLVTSV